VIRPRPASTLRCSPRLTIAAVGAAPVRVARRSQLEAERGQALVDAVDGKPGERPRLRADGRHARLGDQQRSLLHRGGGQDRWRAGEPAADARIGLVGPFHLELVALAEPALDRGAQAGLAVLSDVQVGGRARPSVQVLVGAAHRQLDAPPAQVHGHGAGRVAEIPDQRSGRLGGDALDVGQRTGAVGDMGEAHQGDLAAAACARHVGRSRSLDRVRLEAGQLTAMPAGQAVEYVAVGGEIAAVGDDRPLAGLEHGGGELEEVDGGGVGHDHLTRLGAEHTLGEQVAGPLGQIDPRVPAGHQVGAPLIDALVQYRPRASAGRPSELPSR
jgi:hypothetical protein